MNNANNAWVGDAMGILGDATKIGSSFLSAGMGGGGGSSGGGGGGDTGGIGFNYGGGT